MFAGEAARLEKLQCWLVRAERLHARLRDDSAPWPDGTRLVSIQSRSHPTMSRAVVMRDGDGWKTLFLGDPELEGRTALQGLLAEDGDIHASVSSQQTLTPSELRALGSAGHDVSGDHLTVAHQEETLRLLGETVAGSN